MQLLPLPPPPPPPEGTALTSGVLMAHIARKVRRLDIERNVLFNDALNTFYLRLYGVRHMVKDF